MKPRVQSCTSAEVSRNPNSQDPQCGNWVERHMPTNSQQWRRAPKESPINGSTSPRPHQGRKGWFFSCCWVCFFEIKISPRKIKSLEHEFCLLEWSLFTMKKTRSCSRGRYVCFEAYGVLKNWSHEPLQFGFLEYFGLSPCPVSPPEIYIYLFLIGDPELNLHLPLASWEGEQPKEYYTLEN